MHNTIISACLQDRETFNLVDSVVNESDFSDKAWIIYKQIRSFYETDSEAQSVDLDTLHSTFEHNYERHAKEFSDYLNGLGKVSVPNMKKTLLDFKAHAAGIRLANSLLSDDPKQEQVLQEYLDIKGLKEEDLAQEVISPSVHDLLYAFSTENLISLSPPMLNERVGGGVPRGTNVLIFAPPESGKTLFSVNLTGGFLESGYKVVYIGNEEAAGLVVMRVFNRLTDMTKEEILNDPDLAEMVAANNGYQNFVFAALSPGSLSDVRRLIERHKPDVVIVDQLRNMSAPISDSVAKMDYLTTGMRNLCKQYGVVGVSLTQGAESAQGKLVLELGDVYYSKVAAQGNVDLMCGIGKNDEYDRTNRRMISICKNKLTGNHDPFVVSINPYLSKME